MSGGAYNGKLAKPVAKAGLHVEIDGNKLFRPDWRESAFVGRGLLAAEKAYGAFPMGTEGFAAVPVQEYAAASKLMQNKYGFRTELVGMFKEAKDGLTGVTLKDIRGSDGKDVYFSGKD